MASAPSIVAAELRHRRERERAEKELTRPKSSPARRPQKGSTISTLVSPSLRAISADSYKSSTGHSSPSRVSTSVAGSSKGGPISLTTPLRSPNKVVIKPRSAVSKRLKASQLGCQDFWPKIVNPAEEQTSSKTQDLRVTTFESFDVLVKEANCWLVENVELGIRVVKCETMEKKISSLSQLRDDTTTFRPPFRGTVLCIKGFRLWYIFDKNSSKLALDNSTPPIQLGYVNITPKCLALGAKYPLFEDMKQALEAVNDYLRQTPLEGRIITVETVALKLSKRKWKRPRVDPDATYYTDEYLRHTLYIMRIYFTNENVKLEDFICFSDFLPEPEPPRWYRREGYYPKYRPLSSAMKKVKDWILNEKNIHVINIQTLEVADERAGGKNALPIDTNVNFFVKVESSAMIKFIRVTYTKSTNERESDERSAHYAPPHGFAYKTLIPAAIKVGKCTGTPHYEAFLPTWNRWKFWLKRIDRNIIGVETLYYPFGHIWHRQDGGEMVVMRGEWRNRTRRDTCCPRRRHLVQVIRLYLDGDYAEPSQDQLPPLPAIREVNECHCFPVSNH